MQIHHEIPRLHPDATMLSFQYYSPIQKAAKEIIGAHNIAHVSINCYIDNLFYYISSTPELGINLVKNGFFLIDGTTSPSFFKHKKFLAWSDTYNPLYANKIKAFKYRVHSLTQGVIFISHQKKAGHLMYSFATNKEPEDFILDAKNNKNFFIEAGNYFLSKTAPFVGNKLNLHLPSEFLL